MLGRVLLVGVISGWASILVGGDLEGLTSDNIYQRLKDCDENGLTYQRFSSEMSVGTMADLLLDEQGKASGGRDDDAAPRALFRHLTESKLKHGCYPEFIALLDNYEVKSGEPEDISAYEQAEIEAFLAKAMESRPMKVAYHYITTNLANKLSQEDFRARLQVLWFELYKNHYGGKTTPSCSGFEHVFVGEGEYADSATASKGEIGGYHNWVQFAQQEKKGVVNYLGTKYDLPADRLPTNPCVITLRMIWNFDPDGDGPEPPVELFKDKGGFFVGMSPECELAMGTVAFFELQKGLVVNDMRRTSIDGATFDLVMHPSVQADGKRGAHVRTFYPVLLGYAQASNASPLVARNGSVLITKAMPNPEGDDENGEWVEIKNVSDQPIELERWTLRDKQNGRKELSGTLNSGETFKIDLSRSSGSKVMLGNSGDQIRLFNASEELIDEVSYQRAKSGEAIEFEK